MVPWQNEDPGYGVRVSYFKSLMGALYCIQRILYGFQVGFDETREKFALVGLETYRVYMRRPEIALVERVIRNLNTGNELREAISPMEISVSLLAAQARMAYCFLTLNSLWEAKGKNVDFFISISDEDLATIVELATTQGGRGRLNAAQVAEELGF